MEVISIAVQAVLVGIVLACTAATIKDLRK